MPRPPASLTRRDALAHLAAWMGVPALLAAQAHDSARAAEDPLLGTIAQFQAGRLRRAWSAEEVTRAALQRAEGRGRALRAVDMLTPDEALRAARASDGRLARGGLIGPLDGVPVFAKSIYDMAGTPTTASSRVWAEAFPAAVARDAVEVARLRAAGAVLLGKTAADDFAYHGNGTSSHTGQVLHPDDPTGTRTPGGSSAGSAVAVRIGMAFAALGTDDGGSNRIPAQFTGVVGVKPTFGLVPRSGVLPTWPILDTHGPLTRTAEDAALVLAVLAGPDGEDALALTAPAPPPAHRQPAASLRGVTLGLVSAHVPRDKMSSAALATWDAAVEQCRRAGATVVEFAPGVDRWNVTEVFASSAAARGDVAPDPRAPGATANALLRYFQRQGGDARAAVARGHAAYRAFYDVLPEAWPQMAALLAAPYETDAALRAFARSRDAATAQLVASMRTHGIAAMVYPTMPFAATRADAEWPDIRTPLGYGNWMGLPEVSIPAGVGPDGMPAGNVSFVGAPGDDGRVLALARAWQAAAGLTVPN